jgi:hypothetical protein
MLRLRAARVGYTKKDIEQFLSDMFDDWGHFHENTYKRI